MGCGIVPLGVSRMLHTSRRCAAYAFVNWLAGSSPLPPPAHSEPVTSDAESGNLSERCRPTPLLVNRSEEFDHLSLRGGDEAMQKGVAA